MNRRLLILPAVALASALALTGCTTSGTPDTTASDSGAITVVASTNVYGDIASQIGGDLVSVSSIIDSADKDPHEYEADARTQLSLSKADVVIENGGGYDDFVDTMLSASGNEDAAVLNVADISGYDQNPADGEFNEHLWYDFPTIATLAKDIATEFATLDPDNTATYDANAETFIAQIEDLQAKEAQIKADHGGTGVAITEPVPLYMLEASGLVNKTPEQFSEAVEQGTDVPANVLAEVTDMFGTGSIGVLVYNEQTSGAQTDAVLKAAESNDVPVVSVAEILPEGTDYISWMTSNLDALTAALTASASGK